MRELALHILDLVENSLRAGASIVAVAVEAESVDNLLRITIADNGSGLKVRPEEALDPFYTTKQGKKTGLGLSLFQGAAEQTGGRLVIGKSELGPVGVKVIAELGLAHIDRAPLGDLAGTLATIVCTNPDVEFRIRVRCGEHGGRLSTRELARELGCGAANGLALGNAVRTQLARVLHECPVLR